MVLARFKSHSTKKGNLRWLGSPPPSNPFNPSTLHLIQIRESDLSSQLLQISWNSIYLICSLVTLELRLIWRMHYLLQKVLVFDTTAGFFTLLLLPSFTACSLSSSQEFQENSQLISIKQHVNKVDSQKTFDIEVHGIMLWASMGFLMPAGILTIRLSKMEECNQIRLKVLFYIHAILQVVSVLVATAGAVLSIKSFDNTFNNNHQRIGLALYVAIYVQLIMGFRRPKRGIKGRSVWYFFHWLFGTTLCLAGIINTYTGLKAYHEKTSKSISLWTIIFTAQLSFMGFFYLFQDKWEYIQKQGVVVVIGNGANTTPTHQVIVVPHSESIGKELVLAEPCRKSNALGTYFSRSTALKKLFQQT